MSNISVIIPVINEEERIEQCLKAVFDQSIQPFEVIVVDGHSKDLTVEKAKHFPVKIFYEEFHTRAGACQVGLKNALGDFVAFTDADCIPEKSWLENLIKEFDHGIVGVGGGIKNIGERPWERSINLAANTFLGSANSVQGRLYEERKFVKSISGCNSIYRKNHLVEAGGFNLSLSTAEDTEINRRLLKIGKLVYTPAAIVLHDHKRGLEAFGKRMYQYGYGRGRSMIWDTQVIPPLILPSLIISLIVTRWIFLITIVLYLSVLVAFGFKFSVEERNPLYFISIPIVYAIEHVFYTIGLWRGTLSKLRGARRESFIAQSTVRP